MRILFSRIGLACLSTLVTFGALEGIARVTYEGPWHARLRAVQRESESYPYRLNRFGLRGSEPPAVRAPGERRVLVLGDSFTFGQGVYDDARIFPEILEQRLDGAAHGVTVLNGGEMGSLTGDWLRTWERVGPGFDPDLVLLVFFLRDGTRVGSIGYFFQEIHEGITLRNQASGLYRRVFLYRWLRDALDRRAIVEHYAKVFRDSYFGDAEQTAEWQRARQNLLELRDRIRRQGAAVGFVVFPILVELDARYPFRDICELLEGFARENDMPVHDLLADFMGQSAPDLWVSPYDQHPNEAAHAIAAEALLPFVERLLEDARSAPGRAAASGSAGRTRRLVDDRVARGDLE